MFRCLYTWVLYAYLVVFFVSLGTMIILAVALINAQICDRNQFMGDTFVVSNIEILNWIKFRPW